jgi:hypothetical protein
MKEKKRISMTALQELAKKIEDKEKGLAILTNDGKLKLRRIIILHFDMLGYEIYYEK